MKKPRMMGLRKLIPGRKKKDTGDDISAQSHRDDTPLETPGTIHSKTSNMSGIPSRNLNNAVTASEEVVSNSSSGMARTGERPLRDDEETINGMDRIQHLNGEITDLDEVGPMQDLRLTPHRTLSISSTQSDSTVIFDDAPNVVLSYDAVPLLELIKLPRGGVSMETQAVGRVQFGIPPETIKDSMRLGLSVPAVYIVPVERFCREMGPALGVNLAEFEFPAYFNFFVSKKRCTLVVDSEEAEQNIRRVFSETLLGPGQFRRLVDPITSEDEDFDPEFPHEARPNFQKELEHFRIMPDGKQLIIETLLDFRHFEMPGDAGMHENLGIPPLLDHLEQKCAMESPQREEKNPSIEAKKQDGKTPWTYSQARWIGDVATVWPINATDEEKTARSCKRVEIFKMPGGTEYILHDIDENNHIVGKARFSGHVKVSESMSVDGFGGKSFMDDTLDLVDEVPDSDVDSDSSEALDLLLEKNVLPPTFHPPSFGVTVLGNSHGFDKSGSVSGYVLWINGRGVMIDPPPYSSATLEREGIRPRTIVGIILTHCHADHDAGAFQKVLTGSPVVVITTPTIYKSFIRKYAALSALSPALLRHSHRHKPAVIGRPLRFQGATFHFTYTLHAIPCVGFRVDWRGRSMVFTGDHLNSPPVIDKLQASGVLSKARADDLRNLPLQETDLLLHEAGAPPLHTPLDVLLKLPERVKRRMYVVHTSALPEGCELRVAPTGTAGTIRLDQVQKSPAAIGGSNIFLHKRVGSGSRDSVSISLEDDDVYSSPWSSASNEYEPINEDMMIEGNNSDPRLMVSSFSHLSLPNAKAVAKATRSNSLLGTDNAPPLVSLRPASSTDAWFILNLLSAVPFLTSLSYASTMEVLETARVDAYCKDDIIVPSSRRSQVLCVVWEGTCVEREKNTGRSRACARRNMPLIPIREVDSQGRSGAVWHAGDWTGPISLQPDKRLSGDSPMGSTHDIVAMSLEGVKVITVEFSNLHAILKSGSALYRKYLARRTQQRKVSEILNSGSKLSATEALLDDAIKNLNVLELLDCNSALRKLSAVQKRHLESLAEGPVSFQPGERLWRSGAPVDRAFIVISGTASFVPRRRNAGSVGLPASAKVSKPNETENMNAMSLTLGETMRLDAITAVRELRIPHIESSPLVPVDSEGPINPHNKKSFQLDAIFTSRSPGQEGVPSTLNDAHDYAKLSRGLQKRADILNKQDGALSEICEAELVDIEDDDSHTLENVFLDLESEHHHQLNQIKDSASSRDRRMSLARRRSSRARFANKVLGRLYSRRAFTGGLVFSRGHFLGDVSKMVAGLLSTFVDSDVPPETDDENGTMPKYGFGEKTEGGTNLSGEEQSDDIIHEHQDDTLVAHTSTLTAGKEGCVVLVFPKASLIPFLDEYPGLLLSLLGTQVVV